MMLAADIQGIFGIGAAEGKGSKRNSLEKKKAKVGVSEKSTNPKTNFKKKNSHIDVARRLLKGTSIDVEDIINQIAIKKLDENYFLDSLRKYGKKAVKKWKIVDFTSSARDDNLVLSHLVRVDKEEKNYRFAVFNKKYPIPEFSEELYNAAFGSEDWSREETEYLMEMTDKYHLLWPVISDRYCFNGRSRDANELKRRFFFIDDYVKVFKDEQPSGFDYLSEKRRREVLDSYLSATIEEAVEEELALKQYTLLMRHENELLARKKRRSLEILNSVGKNNKVLKTTTATSDDGIKQIVDFATTSKPMEDIPNFMIGAQSISEILTRGSERTIFFFNSVHEFYDGSRIYSRKGAQDTIRMRMNFNCIAECKGALMLLVNELENVLQKLNSLNIKAHPLPRKCEIDYFMMPRPSSLNRRFQFVSLFSIIPPVFPPSDIMDYSSGEPKRRYKLPTRFPEKAVIPEGVIPKQVRPASPPKKRKSSGDTVLNSVHLTPQMRKRPLVEAGTPNLVCPSPRIRRKSSTGSKRSRFSSSDVCGEISDECRDDGTPVVTRSGRTVRKKNFYDDEFDDSFS